MSTLQLSKLELLQELIQDSLQIQTDIAKFITFLNTHNWKLL